MDDPSLLLCADGGGTSVSVVIIADDGTEVRGSGGPCNVYSVGPQEASAAILRATYRALGELPAHYLPLDFRCQGIADDASDTPALSHSLFKFAWIALAGISQPNDVAILLPWLLDGLRLTTEQCSVTNDVNLLAAPALSRPAIQHVAAVVAGTGTKAVAIRRLRNHSGYMPLKDVGVSGGWGYVLDDEGSAFMVGRAAIRSVLRIADKQSSEALYSTPIPGLAPFHRAVLDHFGLSDPLDLIDVASLSGHRVKGMSIDAAAATRNASLAGVARVVLSHAFPATGAASSEALQIAKDNTQPLVELAINLLGDLTVVEPETTLLSLGGGMWRSDGFREYFLAALSERMNGRWFAEVLVVHDAAREGARGLRAHGRQPDA